MPDPAIIIDAGPLVAYLNRRDQYHAWTVSIANDLALPFITSESVISEVMFLLNGNDAMKEAVLQMLESRTIQIAIDADAHIKELIALMRRYADLPMSLADATLVRLAEIHELATVFTLDKHFRIYRRNKRQIIPVIAPWNHSQN